ncbi:hypothetical protein L1N85_19525 [Paenibacillus alkaliterrae]|uniref:hypothetical protein n=1 Tax=Paenibacillus alkaliterrae TaxID=320909 RepID=UPI001F18C82F|nr:hypothetical protein [Paenibacillus alkaliterrae]MCF2940587.1 hypothetical protein [Paenibacillus alkaliterrae]
MNPLLYVKQVNDGLFLANYPSNAKKDIRLSSAGTIEMGIDHFWKRRASVLLVRTEFMSPLTLIWRRPTRPSKPEQPAIAKFTDPKEKRERAERKVKLTSLFFTMLQEYKVSEYRPGGRRNIASRLYKIAEIIKVNRMPLSEILYVADKTGRWPNKDKHQLIIGWGRRREGVTPYPTNTKFVRLPLYSIDEPARKVTDLTVLKNIYDQCVSNETDVDDGYYMLFRGPANKSDKNIWDRQLCFIPAEEKTRIPVESSYEAAIIRNLHDKKRHFEKPLIGNITELFPELAADIVLHDTDPKTIIEVAGSRNTATSPRLQEKRESYGQKGYAYMEWDGESPFPF